MEKRRQIRPGSGERPWDGIVCPRATLIEISDDLFGGFGQFGIAVKKPHGGMGVKQIARHLHIVLEILKRFVKVIRNAELPLGATKTALFIVLRTVSVTKGCAECQTLKPH